MIMVERNEVLGVAHLPVKPDEFLPLMLFVVVAPAAFQWV